MTVELLNMDCMDYLRECPDKSFDLAIVDPPYGIGLGFSAEHSFKGTKTKGHEQKTWNNQIPSSEYFEQLYRVSKNQIIWGCNYFGSNIKDVGRIVFNKKPTPFISSSYSHADLASCSMQKRITLFEFQWSGNVQGGVMNTNGRECPDRGLEKRIHPTQKPVKLYQWLLDNYAEKGQRILDTHLGSGSSAIAAHYFGCDFVGIELDKDYYDAACKRFDQMTRQEVLF